MEKQQAIKLSSLVLALIVGGGLTYWYVSGKPVRKLNAVMEDLALATARDFAEKMPRIQEVEELLVVPKIGGRDEDTRLKDIVFDALGDAKKYSIQEWDRLRKKMENGPVWDMLIAKSGLLPGEAPKDIGQAAKAADILARSNIKIDAVLFIHCVFDQGARDDAFGASVELKAQFYDLKTKKELTDKEYKARTGIDSTFDRLYLMHKLEQTSFLARFVGWALLVTLQPWALIGLCRWGLRKKDNITTLSILGAFSMVGVGAAWPLLLSLASLGFGSIVFLLLVAGAVGYYNHDALDYIDRRLL